MNLTKMTNRDKLKLHFAILIAKERQLKNGEWKGTPEEKEELLRCLKILHRARKISEDIEEQRRDLDELEKNKQNNK